MDRADKLIEQVARDTGHPPELVRKVYNRMFWSLQQVLDGPRTARTGIQLKGFGSFKLHRRTIGKKYRERKAARRDFRYYRELRNNYDYYAKQAWKEKDDGGSGQPDEAGQGEA